MRIKIKIGKRTFYIISILLLATIVIAMWGNDPSKMGHSGGEIRISDGNKNIKLQQLIDQDLTTGPELNSKLTTLRDSTMDEIAQQIPQGTIETIDIQVERHISDQTVCYPDGPDEDTEPDCSQVTTRFCLINYGPDINAYRSEENDGSIAACNKFFLTENYGSTDSDILKILLFLNDFSKEKGCVHAEWVMDDETPQYIKGTAKEEHWQCWGCPVATATAKLNCYKYPY